MDIRKVSVKIIDASSSYVSFKYLSSNSRSRIKRREFIHEYQNGKIDVVNPDLLHENK
ncbi:MAG: hypothetical protein P1U56_14485 [Saprospiraceae bacterium]|nr:hypothetical protein [Saprospiraceae bacterium]